MLKRPDVYSSTPGIEKTEHSSRRWIKAILWKRKVVRKAVSRSEMIHGDFAIVSSLLADQMLYSDVFAATMDQSRVTNKRKANS